MVKSNFSHKTRIAAGIAAVCAVACILYSRVASRVGMAGLVTYAASAASMVLAALLLGGVCAVLTGMVLRDVWAKGPNQRLDFSYKEAFKAERPVLLCAVLEVAGVVGVWALGIAVSGFLPYGAVRMALVAGRDGDDCLGRVCVARVSRASGRCNVVLLRGRVISGAIVVAVAMLACAALRSGSFVFIFGD
ncbi:MAG: hypothetical protein ACLRX5_02175 [Slackia sp.]